MLKNNEIPNGIYKVIDQDGTLIGIMPIPRVLQEAAKRNVDAILVNDSVKPGIIKLQEQIDENKQKYLLSKASKKQKNSEIKSKEYKIDNINIAKGDYDRLINNLIEAVLTRKISAKLIVIIKGRYRDNNHINMAVEKFETAINRITAAGGNLQSKNMDREKNIFTAIFR